MVNILLLILFLCLIIIPVYFKTIRFDRFWGILMFVLGFSALYLRFSTLSSYPAIGILNENTIKESFLLMLAPTAVFLFFGIYSGHFKRRIRRLEKLLIPYMFFGGLQQILFFFIFSDSVYYLTKSINITFIATIVFFVAVHLNWKASIRKYWFLLIIFAIINTWIYLIWKNILPQILIHGLVGSILFTDFSDENPLKVRTGRS